MADCASSGQRSACRLIRRTCPPKRRCRPRHRRGTGHRPRRCRIRGRRRSACPGRRSPSDRGAGRAHSIARPARGRLRPGGLSTHRELSEDRRQEPRQDLLRRAGSGRMARRLVAIRRTSAGALVEVGQHVEPDADEDAVPVARSRSARAGCRRACGRRPRCRWASGYRARPCRSPARSSASITATAVARASFGSDSTAKPMRGRDRSRG